MVQNTVKSVFLYKLYVKCGCYKVLKKNFSVNLPGSQFQAQQASINLSVSQVSYVTLKPIKNTVHLTKRNWSKTGGTLEHSPSTSPRHLA
jgi:hypothetical protein